MTKEWKCITQLKVCQKSVKIATRWLIFCIKIGSLNVHGLGNRVKRKCIFQYIRDWQIDVAFLQETHCTKNKWKLWESEWGNRMIQSISSSMSKGTAILFRPNSKFIVNKSFSDENGRFVICNASYEEQQYTLCNLYAPNEDNPKFLNTYSKS